MGTMLWVLAFGLAGSLIVALMLRSQRNRARHDCQTALEQRNRAIDHWHALLALFAEASAGAQPTQLEVKRARYDFFSQTRARLTIPVEHLVRATLAVESVAAAAAANDLVARGTVTRLVSHSYVDQWLAGGRSSDNQRTGLVEEWIEETDDAAARALLADPDLFKRRLRE